MNDTIFKIIYIQSTLFGSFRKEVIVREKKAFKLLKKCHKRNYPIITIQHI